MLANRSTVNGRQRYCLLLLLLLLLVGGLEKAAAQPYLTCLIEATSSHETIVLPYNHSQLFDSATLAEFLLTMSSRPKNFSTYKYSTLHWNTSYGFPLSADRFYPEAVYDSGMAGVVASGPVLDYHPGEVLNASGNKNGYGYPGSGFIRVCGHLFDGGLARDSDTLLRVNVWCTVNTRHASGDSSGSLTTAETDNRFLYKSLAFTKGEFVPNNFMNPDFARYRDAFRRIDFRGVDPGGLAENSVPAYTVNLEVIYLGGEKLALHSIAICDSIYHLLTSPGVEGDAYRQRVLREVDTLLCRPLQRSTWNSLHNLSLTDEPLSEKTAGSFHVRRMIHSFLYRRTPSNVYLLNNRSSTTATIPDRTSP